MLHNWKNIHRNDVKELINKPDALLIDVREVEEFNEGQIPRTVNIPLNEFSQRITGTEISLKGVENNEYSSR